MSERQGAYGEGYTLSRVDRFGVWLSARRIRKFVPDFRGKRIADAGCGYRALFARDVQPVLASAHLIDVSLDPELTQLPNVTCLEGNLLQSLRTLANNSMDVVLCISVLEHLSEPQDALREFHRVLAPGGVCLINVPTWMGKRALEFSAFRLGLSPRSEMEDHKMYYGKRDLWPLLVRAGFAPSRIRLDYHKFGLNLFAAMTRS